MNLLLDGCNHLWFTCYDLEADVQLIEFATPICIECEFSCLGEAPQSLRLQLERHSHRTVQASTMRPIITLPGGENRDRNLEHEVALK